MGHAMLHRVGYDFSARNRKDTEQAIKRVLKETVCVLKHNENQVLYAYMKGRVTAGNAFT